MNFTAIDFETAHANYPCEIGISKVENLCVVETKSWLIKPACFPYMNYWNQRVHGITSEDLMNERTFEELWIELKPYFEDQILVAHNAAFDMKVLTSSLIYYDLVFPHMEYFCSVNLSRKIWRNMSSHSLGALAEAFNLKFNFHRAGDDARACAEIAIRAIREAEVESVDDLASKTGIHLKMLNRR